MRIAQIAPLTESCPPRLYGGTERIVSYLTEELVAQGHDVTLFASGDSRTRARLIACSEGALRLDPDAVDAVPHLMVMLDRLRRMAGQFDIAHFHIDLLHIPLMRALALPSLTTLHGRLDLPDLVPFYSTFDDAPVVSISDDQRRPLPRANWVATVQHGLPRDLLRLNERPSGDYLAFLGRISPEKRPEAAIDIAARAGLPLKIAAKIDKVDRVYWEQVIEPLVRSHDNVEYIGEIGEGDKAEFLGNARALVFPIDWPEPFGMVMIEAMACGTPVIAARRGSVNEVIDDGVSGFVVDDVGEAVAATQRIGDLDRRRVRACFDRRFTADRMARDYVSIYRELMHHARCAPPRRAPLGLRQRPAPA